MQQFDALAHADEAVAAASPTAEALARRWSPGRSVVLYLQVQLHPDDAQGHRLGEWLAALRLPSDGTVTFNGVETSRARTPGLRETVAFVRRGDLFEGTVLENVTAGRDLLTAAEARAALEKVGLLDELRALPDGIDTHLYDSGAPLDPGQTVRLLVARAIAGAPRLVVVDESLEGLDAKSRAQCVAALTRPQAPWTLVALVNDPASALARACDTTHTLAEVHA